MRELIEYFIKILKMTSTSIGRTPSPVSSFFHSLQPLNGPSALCDASTMLIRLVPEDLVNVTEIQDLLMCVARSFLATPEAPVDEDADWLAPLSVNPCPSFFANNNFLLRPRGVFVCLVCLGNKNHSFLCKFPQM